MNAVRNSILLVALLAGCTAGPLASEGAYLRTSPPLNEAGQGGAFTPSEHVISIVFFNATKPAMGTYAFRVGDGGTASACFVSQQSIDSAIAGHYGDPFEGILEEVGCVGWVAEAEVREEVPAGAWAYMLMTAECPHRDCSYWISTIDHPGTRSSITITTAEEVLGHAVEDE